MREAKVFSFFFGKSRGGTQKPARKQSFFEKKDQKAFVSWLAPRHRSFMLGFALAEAVATLVQATEQEFFASFLQKRRPSLLAFAQPGAVTFSAKKDCLLTSARNWPAV